MARRILTHQEQFGAPLLRIAAHEAHPDLAELLGLCGCHHTTGGRVLYGNRRTAAISEADQEARLGDQRGWLHHVAFEPVQFAVGGARDYAAKMGLGDPHASGYEGVRQTPDAIRSVGRHYDSLPDFDERAVLHFDAMRNEVDDQFDFATNKLGITPEFVSHDPYADAHEMLDDINTNRRLQVLNTASTGGHPFFDNDTNDRFRFVHDLFGHAATGRSFDRHGEQAAYLAHSQMFSPKARPAMATETRGQNSSLILNGMFAPQKVATMDPQHWKIGRTADTFRPQPGFGGGFYDPEKYLIKEHEHQQWLEDNAEALEQGDFLDDIPLEEVSDPMAIRLLDMMRKTRSPVLARTSAETLNDLLDSDELSKLLDSNPWGSPLSFTKMTLKEILEAGVDSKTVQQWLQANPDVDTALKDPQNPAHEPLLDQFGDKLQGHLSKKEYPALHDWLNMPPPSLYDDWEQQLLPQPPKGPDNPWALTPSEIKQNFAAEDSDLDWHTYSDMVESFSYNEDLPMSMLETPEFFAWWKTLPSDEQWHYVNNTDQVLSDFQDNPDGAGHPQDDLPSPEVAWEMVQAELQDNGYNTGDQFEDDPAYEDWKFNIPDEVVQHWAEQGVGSGAVVDYENYHTKSDYTPPSPDSVPKSSAPSKGPTHTDPDIPPIAWIEKNYPKVMKTQGSPEKVIQTLKNTPHSWLNDAWKGDQHGDKADFMAPWASTQSTDPNFASPMGPPDKNYNPKKFVEEFEKVFPGSGIHQQISQVKTPEQAEKWLAEGIENVAGSKFEKPMQGFYDKMFGEHAPNWVEKKPKWDPNKNAQPTSLDSPMFSAEDRPMRENSGKNKDLQYFFSPNDYNPVSTSGARPNILWDRDKDYFSDEVLPGLPTENRSVKLYRGEPLDLNHPGAKEIRDLLYGEQDADWGAQLPGMEGLRAGPWSSDDPDLPTPFHNPELGQKILDHWERNRGIDKHSPEPTDLQGLGRHWTLSPSETNNWSGGGSTRDRLPVRFVSEFSGQGEDPYRTNTDGEHPSEQEITKIPGSPTKIVDVQVKSPTHGWVSAWPEGHSETRYSSVQNETTAALLRLGIAAPRMVATDDEYAQRLQKAQSILNSLPDDQFTHVKYTNPDGSWSDERSAAHRELVDEVWRKYGEHVPRNKQGLIVGGLPGSGKTTVLKQLEVPGVGIANDNFLRIDPDEFKTLLVERGLAPKIDGLTPMEVAPLIHRESSYLAKLLAARAYENGTNVAWDGTLRDEDGATNRLDEFAENEYTPHGTFVDIPLEQSHERAQKRHREGNDLYNGALQGYGGRIVPPDFIDGSASPDPHYSSINRMNWNAIQPRMASWSMWDNSGDKPVMIDSYQGDDLLQAAPVPPGASMDTPVSPR